MMKKVAVIVLILMCAFTVSAFADEKVEQEMQDQISDIDTGAWQNFIDSLEGTSFAGKNIKDIILEIASGGGVGIESVFDAIKAEFENSISSLVFLVMQLMALGIIAGMSERSKETLSATGVSEISGLVITCVALTVIVANLTSCVKQCTETIGLIAELSQIIMPVITPLLVSAGGSATAGLMQPTSSLLGSIIGVLIKNVLLPLLTISGIFSLVNSVSSRLGLGGMGNVLKSIHNWVLRTVFVVFSGFLTLKGISAGGIDSISIRALKYTVGNSVPVIGGLFGDSIDLVLSCSLVLKNAIGIAGVLLTVSIALTPIIKLLSLALALNIASAAVQPFGGEKLSGMAKAAHNWVIGMVVLLMASAVLLILALALVISIGNGINWVR